MKPKTYNEIISFEDIRRTNRAENDFCSSRDFARNQSTIYYRKKL